MRRLSQSHKHTGGGQRYIPNQKTEEQEGRERSQDGGNRRTIPVEYIEVVK